VNALPTKRRRCFVGQPLPAAQAYQVSRLYRRPDVLAPFTQHGLNDIGHGIARMVFTVPDQGHRSDMAATTSWAKTLGLGDWFAWAPYTEGR